LDGDGRRTVAPSQYRILGTDLDVTDLTQRERASRAARQGQLAESRGVEALGACAARHHFHRTDIFPNLSHTDSGWEEMKSLCRLTPAQPPELQHNLIERQIERCGAVSADPIHIP